MNKARINLCGCEMREGKAAATRHLSLVVVQIQVLSVLLLSIPPPPLGGSAPLGPSGAQSKFPFYQPAGDTRSDCRLTEEAY